MKNLKIKNIMIVILYTTLLIFFFIHINDVFSVLKTIFTVLSPVMYGLVIAYLMNYPYKAFHNHVLKNMGAKHSWLKKFKKPLSSLLAYIIVFGAAIYTLVEEGAERRLKKKQLSANDVAPAAVQDDSKDQQIPEFKDHSLLGKASELFNNKKANDLFVLIRRF